jgi:hypothetical protein
MLPEFREKPPRKYGIPAFRCDFHDSSGIASKSSQLHDASQVSLLLYREYRMLE